MKECEKEEFIDLNPGICIPLFQAGRGKSAPHPHPKPRIPQKPRLVLKLGENVEKTPKLSV